MLFYFWCSAGAMLLSFRLKPFCFLGKTLEVCFLLFFFFCHCFCFWNLLIYFHCCVFFFIPFRVYINIYFLLMFKLWNVREKTHHPNFWTSLHYRKCEATEERKCTDQYYCLEAKLFLWVLHRTKGDCVVCMWLFRFGQELVVFSCSMFFVILPCVTFLIVLNLA